MELIHQSRFGGVYYNYSERESRRFEIKLDNFVNGLASVEFKKYLHGVLCH